MDSSANFPDLDKAIQARQQHDYQTAERLFTELLAAQPDDPRLNYHYAWLCDAQGLERRAVAHYEKALAGELPPDERRGALLGLGSTYRTLGEYERAAERLRQGLEAFPAALEFELFYAMTLYNLGRSREAVSLLLQLIADHLPEDKLAGYQPAVRFYAQNLDQVWDE